MLADTLSHLMLLLPPPPPLLLLLLYPQLLWLHMAA
jgi:hypothetical protein